MAPDLPLKRSKNCSCKMLKARYFAGFQTNCGGEAGIRTLAAVARTNGLANRPLRPAWVLLHNFKFLYGGESEIRTHGSLTTTPVFKTGALNQLDHLSTS